MQRGRPIISSDGRTLRCLELNVHPSCALASRASAPCGRWEDTSSSLAPFQPVSWT